MRALNFIHNRQTPRWPYSFPEMPLVELLITVGRARQRIRRVTGPVFLIGSSMDCDLILGDALVPSVHCYILLTPQGVRLRHLGAPPEIRVNGQPLDVAKLEDRDEIAVGQFSFMARIQWPVPDQSPRPAAEAFRFPSTPLTICHETAEPVPGVPPHRRSSP
ncbi:MAG: FHA domain-containing protein [Pirellulaceae bacterium]